MCDLSFKSTGMSQRPDPVCNDSETVCSDGSYACVWEIEEDALNPLDRLRWRERGDWEIMPMFTLLP